MLRAVARTEFGRRGYEATTVRDIAAAAGMSVGTVYRLIGSKDELLASIMRAFTVKARSGWASVLRSEGTPVEKLDALIWININAVVRFSDEYNIQLAWIRESPPNTTNLGASFSARLNDLRSLLARASALVTFSSKVLPPTSEPGLSLSFCGCRRTLFESSVPVVP